MIGGYDIIMELKDILYPDLENSILNICRKYWPELSVVYDEIGGETLKDRTESDRSEFFIHKTEEDKKLWDELGADDKTFNTMIYVIIEKQHKQMTLVLDNPNEPEDIVKILKEIKEYASTKD
jgi:hypothetical protein